MKELDNVVLIGMPGSGKSTVGVVLAKKLGYEFIDSDLIIQNQYGKVLQELIEAYGVEGFWEIEGKVNASFHCTKTVIATGGSAIYQDEAMEHLRSISRIVYLKSSYEEIEKRLGDLNERGVTLQKGQSLKDLYMERTPLYEKYAHEIIDCDGKMIREVILMIIERLQK